MIEKQQKRKLGFWIVSSTPQEDLHQWHLQSGQPDQMDKTLQKAMRLPQEERKRGGIRARLTRLGLGAAPLPALLLAYVQMEENKVDEVRIRFTQ